MNLSLISATAADRQFLYELHRATMREHIIRTWGWDEDWQQADLLEEIRALLGLACASSKKRAV